MGTTKQVVELRAWGPDDPGGQRTASVLTAYFQAERTRTFRQILWRRLLLCAASAWLVEATTPLLPRAALLVVFVACMVVAVGAMLAEWRAQEALTAQLAQCPDVVVRTIERDCSDE